MRSILHNKIIYTFTALLLAGTSLAQSRISGKVISDKGKPIIGASVYLDNTLDGGTTDSSGSFSFSTEEKGNQTIIASDVSHENGILPITISEDMSDLSVKLKSKSQRLEEVTVTAGSFEASGNGKTVLQPLDIVTTAGAQADIVRAIQMLPGTQQQGNQTGLFVRGGDASESAVIVDGLTAQNAFLSTPPGVAARSRFGAFSFKGIAFSSGGYSARYGQALSSVLELNSNDMPDKSTINTGVNMAGVYFSGSKVLKTTSVEGSATYINLSPFYKIAEANVDYYKVPSGLTGSTKFNWMPNKDGIVKVMGSYSRFLSGTLVPDPDTAGKTLDFGIDNLTAYGMASYRQKTKDKKWETYVAGGYSYNQDDITWNTMQSVNKDSRQQLRLEAKRFATSRLSILAGGELQHFSYNRTFGIYKADFTETQYAGYAEAEWNVRHWLTVKPGLRYEHSVLLNEDALSPRLAMAVKAGLYGQFSVASGVFYQTPDQQYLLYGYRPGLQQSIHYIANYQYMHNLRTLRIEGYYKSYDQLIRERIGYYDANSFRLPTGKIDNSGYGYAQGAELFWRDKKTVKNADYWISYSYIDTRRLFKNYLAETQPDFIATHNLNIITKYFIEKINTQVNVTYNFASGRPYYNPTRPISEFLVDRTPQYHNLSLTVNYLRSFKKWFSVVYAGVDNITNHKNIFGYRYSPAGTRYAMRPALYRSVFVGVHFSLTAFDKDEL
jgi:hypothetical protein